MFLASALLSSAALAQYPSKPVRFVVQGTLPAVDRATGDLLRESPGHLALSPDGHGGLLTALSRSGDVDRFAWRTGAARRTGARAASSSRTPSAARWGGARTRAWSAAA